METLGQPATTDYPDWSGQFWRDSDDTLGYMSLAYSDDRTHLPPEGWCLLRIEDYEDSEVLVYRRITDTCMCCIESGGSTCLNCYPA